MDELIAALGNIKKTVNTDGSVRFEDVKALNAWLVSSKPATIEAYMQALRGVYGYGHACAMEQGRDLNQLCPELEKGMMVQFEQAPARLKAYAWEFLGNLRKQYPFIAAQLNYAISESREPKLKLVAPSSTRAA